MDSLRHYLQNKLKPVAIWLTQLIKYSTIRWNWHAAVAQSVEHFIGNEEVRQFKSAQQLHLLKALLN